MNDNQAKNFVKKIASEIYLNKKKELMNRDIRLIINLLIKLSILFLIIFFENKFNFYFKTLLVLLCGIIHYHFIVAIHECMHSSFFFKKKLNKTIGEVLSYLEYGIFEVFQETHINHHNTYLTKKDPDKNYYNYKKNYFKNSNKIKLILNIFLKSFPFFNFREKILRCFSFSFLNNDQINKNQKLPKFSLFKLLSLHLLLYLFIFKLSGQYQYFLYWMLPSFFISRFLSNLRITAEHGGKKEKLHASPFSARTTFNCNNNTFLNLEKTILSPYGFNFHHEHHICPYLPFVILEQVHRKLVKLNYYNLNKDKNILNSSYLNFYFKNE